jgi:single-stranded-DNA-specific exonuclease
MPTDTRALEDLARSASISPIVAQLLLARGISEPSQVAAFLDPKLSDLRDPARGGCVAPIDYREKADCHLR